MAEASPVGETADRGSRAAPAAALARRAAWPAAVLAILVLAAALRFHGLGWDQPAGAEHPLQMHPDERFLSMVADRTDWPDSVGGYFDTPRSPLNPYNDPETHSYVYGTFPLFLVKAVTTLAGDDPAGPHNSYDASATWGRRVTAAVDVATAAIVFALGATLFGRRAGGLGALLYALAVFPTQLAHFFTMDPYVTFFAAATLYLSALLVSRDRLRWRLPLALLLGVCLGLGLACKVTAWPLALGPVMAAAIRIGLRDLPGLGLRWRGHAARPRGHWTAEISLLCLVALVAMLTFRVAQPYAFTGPGFWDMGISTRWRADIEGEFDRQNGNANYPPFVQFANRTPFLVPLKNMVLYGMGPALGVAAWMSLAAGTVLLFRRRELAFLLPLGLAAAIFLFQGPRFVAFMRYFLPMYPVLCVLAGWGLIAFAGWTQARGTGAARRWLPRALAPPPAAVTYLGLAVLIGTAAFSGAWALAFQNVYRGEHPRIQASRWIYANIPQGARITAEAWDDSLPYYLPGEPVGVYRIVETEPYETDSPAKVRKLVYGSGAPNSGGLAGADYVSISSARVRDSVKRLEREYPATIRYYELLESGALGFERVATFALRPSLFGIAINDAGAEESFTVYDHPEVRIYRKTAAWDPVRAVALLDEAHPERAIDLLPRQGRTNGLHQTPSEAAAQQAGGTFRNAFDADSLAAKAPLLAWLLWLELAALAVLPWATWLFRGLPDRGYGLSKLVGFAGVGLAAWLAVAWGGPHFSGGLSWAVWLTAVAAGAALGARRRKSLATEVRERWRSWLALELVFLGAFALFVAFRWWNPDLWHHPQGGEKPMELAYLTAVARSAEMPPYDPWFGGGTMNYYYMGWFLLAVPMRALRLLPEVAFNLGVPTFAAMAAVVAASTAHNLVALSARTRGLAAAGIGWPALAAGVLGALFLAGIGNLDGGHQLIERLQAVNQWGLFEGTPVLGGATGIAGGAWAVVVEGAGLPPFDWWRSSRVHIGSFDITEFPFWTFLFADLHPHLMAMPIFGLVVALALAYVVSAAGRLERQGHALAFALGIVLGLVRTVHTWDLPAAAIIAGGGIVGGQLLAPGRRDLRWWRGVGHLALAAVVMTVVFAPYLRHFEVFNSGLARTPETTKPYQYFAHFGLFVGCALAFLAVRYHEEVNARAPGSRNPLLAAVAGRAELGAGALFAAGLAAFTWRYGYTVVALSALGELFLLNLLWVEWRAAPRDVARLAATALFALGFAIAAGVDVVRVKDDIERMNTVFKFSLQAWHLFALASAYGACYAATALWEARGGWPRPRPGRRAAAAAFGAAAAVLGAGVLAYPLMGTPARMEARFPGGYHGLDGLAYMKSATYSEDGGVPNARAKELVLAEDLPLIGWLRANVDGSPIVAEAVGPLYHWTGRMSTNTGLPAVVGWDWHQIQQRFDYGGLVQRRRSDTQRFFSEGDPRFAMRYLRTYDVSYVVVGTEERALGTPSALAMFGSLPALTEVFRSGENVIYRVDQAKLPAVQ